MGHPMEDIIRQAYAAFGRGDVDRYLAACTPDFTFNVPGEGFIAGAFHGAEGLYDLAGKAMSGTDGTFREDVEDVLANDQHAVVLARHHFTRGGHPREYRTAHVYNLRDGKLAECWEQPRDPEAFEAAWRLTS